MKRILLTLCILVASAAAVSAQTGLVTTQILKSDCDAYIAGEDNGKTSYDSETQAQGSQRCLGYVKGYMDESSDEMRWKDTGRTEVVVIVWQTVTADQMIRVFVKYVTANPETLNRAAAETLIISASIPGLLKWMPVEKALKPGSN